VRIVAALGLIACSFLVRSPSGAADEPLSVADRALANATEDACASVTDTVSLIGSSSAKEAVTGWGPEICAAAGIVADYTDFGSKGGREAVTPADAAVIGLTSLPFTTEEQAALTEQKRGIVLVPMLTSAVACAYWDTNAGDPATSGTRFPNLRISRRTLADISGGSPRDGTIASPELTADNKDNPDFKVAPPYLSIEPWFRSGSSAVAYRLTEWFHQDPAAEKDFLKGSMQDFTIPFEDIGTPDGSSPSLVNDYATMKSRMLSALQSLGIGCMDNATARTDAKPETETVEALKIAWLDNPSGKFLPPTDAAVTAAAEAMTPNTDGTFSPNWKTTDEKAYALPLLVYAAMPTCGIDAPTRTQMDKVMTYAVGPGQKKLPAGNVAMPKAISETAAKQLATWRKLSAKAAPCTPVVTTTTPQTTVAPTTPTTQPEGGAYVPPADPSSGGGGVYNDPSLGGGSGGGSGSGSSDLPADDAAAAPDTVEETASVDTTTGAVDPGPSTPMRRIVAFATGSQAVPPAALLLGGGSLLLAGPVLQILGGVKRAGTLPAVALAWFLRLKP
jgi:ABC-type phosphate transport system substrate-binding protein